MPNSKSVEDFLASQSILAANIDLFHKGHRDMYRVVAVELRKLLCDHEHSLILRLFSNPLLHPIREEIPKHLTKDFDFFMPTLVQFDGQGGSRIIELFDKRVRPIPLEEWLLQDLFNEHITIRELIKSVADKEGAHSDKAYNPTLQFTKSVKLVTEDIHKQHIVAIGEYVLELMNNTVTHNPNLFDR